MMVFQVFFFCYGVGGASGVGGKLAQVLQGKL